MSTKHSRSHGQYYRYYTSQAIIQGYPHKAGSLPNIPVHEIEKLVMSEVQALLQDADRLQPFLQKEAVAIQKQMLKVAAKWEPEETDQGRLFIRSILSKVVLSNSDVVITLCAHHLLDALKGNLTAKAIPETDVPIILQRQVKLASVIRGSKVVIGSMGCGQNAQLVKAIARSYLWNEQWLSGEVKTVADIGSRENINSPSYITRVMRLRFLAPDIIEAIVEGTQPAEWTVEKLFAVKSLDWREQRIALGVS